MHNYLAHTDEIRQEMLNDIGLKSIDELFDYIKPKMAGLKLPEGLSELEALKKLSEIAAKNTTMNKHISFLGGGVYNRFVPSCVEAIIGRAEFYTSYTPYQPEISQGTLQAIFDYQTLICNLTGMDATNASVYDGATACAEAVLMAVRLSKKDRVLVSNSVNPQSIEVVKTYCCGADIKVDVAEIAQDTNFDDYVCVLIQNPDYYGRVQTVDIPSSGAKLIVSVDPISLGLLKNPGEYGADIVVGDFQPLGISMSYGGPHGGFIACREKLVRQLPGRIVGFTRDKDGKEAFTLTLQAREQHIRRDKATSNICTNTALTALAATVYLSVLGPQGLKEVANISTQRAHYMAEKLAQVPGINVVHDNFLYEFVIKVENFSSAEFIEKLIQKGIFIGIDLGDAVLISVTELNSVEDIDIAVDAVSELFSALSVK